MKRTKLPDIAEIAASQWGLVTSGQTAGIGVDARTLARLAQMGELERLAHGIYRLAGAPISPHDDLRVAWLSFDPRRSAYERIASGPTEVVSHRSAAVIHRIGDLDADMLEFSASVRRQTRRPDVRVHRAEISSSDWQLADGLPVTTPLRTIGDLAESHIDQGHLAGVVRDAIAQHDVEINRVAATLSPFARTYGARAGDGGQFVNRLLRQSGVPRSAIELAAHADGRLRSLAALASSLDSNPAAAAALRKLVEALSADDERRQTGVFGD